MHCFERTLWLCVILAVMRMCQGAPAEEQTTILPKAGPRDTNIGTHTNDDPPAPHASPIHRIDTTTPTTIPTSHLNLEVPNLRLPVHAGPGNYLEERRRQTESRLRELESQVTLLFAAQVKTSNTDLDPEIESRMAIQYGLNCQRGETILVCLMKKMVILRREVSGIQRDMADLEKRFTHLEDYVKSMDRRKGDKTKNGTLDTSVDFKHPVVDTITGKANETTEEVVIDEDHRRQDPSCPKSFERLGDVCYYVVRDRAGSVSSAREYCQAHGGFLARPRDSLTIHDLANHLSRLHDSSSNQLSELWVDGQYQTEGETWRWGDKQKIDRSIWGISNEPNTSHRTGTCVLLKKELNYLAMPQDCGYHYFFVCQASLKKEDTKETT